MSLIDIEPKDIESSKKDFETCKDCNKKINNNSFILLCEDCFNKNINETLNKIKENLIKINTDIKNIEASMNKIKNSLYSENKSHLIILNKLEIDLMNLEAIRKKLIIDKELNESAFVINQKQANKIREELK